MYHTEFASTALADLRRLDKSIAQRILNKIRWLASNLRELTPESLVGEWEGTYKLRVGDYRVIYTLNHVETQMTILFVKHRREVYKIN